MDRGVWRATVHRVTKSQTQLRMRTCTLPEHNGPNWPRLETEKQNKSDSEGRLEELRGLGYPEESGELKEWDTYSGFSFASIGKTDYKKKKLIGKHLYMWLMCILLKIEIKETSHLYINGMPVICIYFHIYFSNKFERKALRLAPVCRWAVGWERLYNYPVQAPH